MTLWQISSLCWAEVSGWAASHPVKAVLVIIGIAVGSSVTAQRLELPVAESFDASSWTAGYWDPDQNGKLTSYGNIHHSDLIPLASLAEGADATAISSSTSYPVLRVNYFDSAGVWIGFDMGEVTDLETGVQKPTPINRPAGAVYVAISANMSDYATISVNIN